MRRAILILAAVTLCGCGQGDPTRSTVAARPTATEDADQAASFDATAKFSIEKHRELRSKAGLSELPSGAPIVRVLLSGGMAREFLSLTAARQNGTWTVEQIDATWDFTHNRPNPLRVQRVEVVPLKARELNVLLASPELYALARTQKPDCVDGADVFLEVLRSKSEFQALRVCRVEGPIQRITAILEKPGQNAD